MPHGRYTKSLPKNVDYSLTERERAIRAAAFIDGEGCIMVGMAGKRLDVFVVIASTTPPLIQWMQDNFGGSIFTRQTRGNRKLCQSWKVSSAAAEYCLEIVTPYLLVKQLQALNALQFRAACFANASNAIENQVDLTLFYRKSSELNNSLSQKQRY